MKSGGKGEGGCILSLRDKNGINDEGSDGYEDDEAYDEGAMGRHF